MTNVAYDLARADLGTTEWGEGHNPKVVQYFADVGHSWVTDDETAWCAAFVGAMLKRAGMPHTGKLNARSYLEWGVPVHLDYAKPGDLVVLWRESPDSWKGHVAFFVRREGDNVILLGGNQSNRVNEQAYPVDKILGVRQDPSGQTPTAVAVSNHAPRQSATQSTTVRASAVQVASGAGAAVSSIAMLDGPAQLVAVGFAALVVLMALWIMRERLRKWAGGDR